MHTLLGVRAFQVEQHVENASMDSNLLLQWQWGFNDVIQVANIATIGALYVYSLSLSLYLSRFGSIVLR
jgi:hypothetical protein